MKRLIVATLLVMALAAAGVQYYLRHRAVSEVFGAPDSVSEPTPVGETADDWPCWRGRRADGAAPDRVSFRWDGTTAVKWRAPVAGRGHSSPIVSGDSVFVTTAQEATGTRSLVCYDRSSGANRWTTDLHTGGLMACHVKNSHASATPACDGRHVFTVFPHDDGLWVSAVRLDGSLDWQFRVGPFRTEWGYGSSVALYRSLVIVSGENKGSKLAHVAAAASYLTALNAETGKVVWCVRRPREASFGTPVVGQIAGRPQLILAGCGQVTSYDPATGREIWHCDWSATRTAGTVAFSDDCVFASATIPGQEIICVRGDGHGDVTGTHVVWQLRRNAPDVPSPLYYGGRLYLITDGGVAICLDATNGKTVWQERLNEPHSASPVLVGDRMYALGEAGTVRVFKAGPRFELESKTSPGGEFYASPAPAGGYLFLRSIDELYCVGGPVVAASPR